MFANQVRRGYDQSFRSNHRVEISDAISTCNIMKPRNRVACNTRAKWLKGVFPSLLQLGASVDALAKPRLRRQYRSGILAEIVIFVKRGPCRSRSLRFILAEKRLWTSLNASRDFQVPSGNSCGAGKSEPTKFVLPLAVYTRRAIRFSSAFASDAHNIT